MTDPAPKLSRNKIWVADDNADVRLLLTRAFKRCDAGLTVEFFSDGAAVVKKARLQGAAPRVLLLDFEMPLMDGLQALKTLANDGSLAHTTVIIFSTEDDDAFVRDAYSSGASFYIRKPCGGDEYRQLARLCVACTYMHLAQQAVDTRALTVTEALGIAAVKSALV